MSSNLLQLTLPWQKLLWNISAFAEEGIGSDTPSDFFDQEGEEEEHDEEVKEEDTRTDPVADGNVVTIKFALSRNRK